MSIATRISSMEEHIKDSYQELKGIGLDITGFNKNLENIPKVIDNYWETLPKVSGSGTDITLDNTKEGKMKIELKGDTYQETTTGKNLYVNNLTSGTYNGVTVTKNSDGSITLNGSTSQTTTYGFTDVYFYGGGSTYETFQIADGNYTLKGTGISACQMLAVLRDSLNNNTTMVAGTNSYTKNVTNIQGARLFIRINDNSSFSNYIIYPQLESGTSSTEYEKYTNGASPNPTYPQAVEVVTGGQNIKIQNKNLINSLRNVNAVYSGSVGTSGAMTAYSNTFTTWIEIKNNATYSFSGDLSNVNSNVVRAFVSNNVPAVGVTVKRVSNLTSSNNTFTNSENYKYLILEFLDTTYNSDYKWQLELGSTVTSYIAHQEQNYEINLGDLELCKIDNYQDRIYRTSGKNLFDKNNNNEIINMFINYVSSPNNYNLLSGVKQKSVIISCEPNTTYTISKIVSFRFMAGYITTEPVNEVTVYGRVSNNEGTSVTITTGENAKYLVVYCYHSDYDTNLQQILDSIQIEKSSTVTSYEPYGYGDWYKHKAIGKVVYKGNESWNLYSSYTYNVFSTTLNGYARISNERTTYSDYYEGVANTVGVADFGNNYNNSVGVRTANDSYNNLYLSNDSITSSDDFKTWLSTHNTTVYYVLAIRVEEPITETTLIEQLNNFYYASSYEEQTNIASRGILATDMSANALEDSSN